MSKIYSKKVQNLLENYKNSSLKILLEEDEEESSSSETSDSEDVGPDDFDFPETKDDSDTSGDDGPNNDGSGGSLGLDSDSGSDDDDIDLDIDDSSPEDLSDTDPEAIEKAVFSALDDLGSKIRGVGDGLAFANFPSDQAYDLLDKPNYESPSEYLDEPEYFEEESDEFDEYSYDEPFNPMGEGYQKKSIGRFIFEEKGEDKVKQQKFDDLEAQIEKLEYLTNLMDAKFNRKTAQVNEEDLPDILNKSIDLITHHDPVEYAYDETIKYLTVKANKKLKERIIEDFKVMFNERCQKEGYDTSSITGISNISPTIYKTGVTGGEN